MDQQVTTASASDTAAAAAAGFAAAKPTFLDRTKELIPNDSPIAVPTIVLMSIVSFLAIIGLSWLMDGKRTRSSIDTTTPRKPQKLGLTVTPAGERRSTRKSHKPEILDPSQPSR